MFVYFKYLVFALCFNHCWGASHMIPTIRYQPIQSGPANYYPVYSLPLGANPNPGELHYSATVEQPSVDTSRGRMIRNQVERPINHQLVAQKPRTTPRPIDIQRPTLTPGGPLKVTNVMYIPNHMNKREPLPQSKPQSAKPVHSSNEKSFIPMLRKAQTSATTLSPMLPSPHFNTKARFVSTNKINKPKSELNTTVPSARVQSINFNYFKSQPQPNYTQFEANFPKDLLRNTQQPLLSQQIYEMPKRQVYGESKYDFRYDSSKATPEYHMAKTTQMSQVTTMSPITEEPTTFVTEPYREEAPNSDKNEKLSSVDSEINYQTQHYNSYNLFNDNEYLQNEPNKEINLPKFGPPLNEDTGVTIPENEVNYSQAEPEPEPLIVEGPYAEPYNNESYDESIDTSNAPELKSLLEQFIQQLDLLKMVAAKELHKGGVRYSSESDGKVISQSVIDPSVSKTGVTYDEYQNERSFEQNLSNTQTKPYKDTYEREGRKPCKKPYHAGALPHLGDHYY